MKKGNHILVQTEDQKLWILSPRTGEISLLTKSNDAANIELNYQIMIDEEAYFFRKADLVFSFYWGQTNARRIRKVHSQSKIKSAVVFNIERAVMKHFDNYFINCNELLSIEKEIEIIFEKEIGDKITVETY